MNRAGMSISKEDVDRARPMSGPSSPTVAAMPSASAPYGWLDELGLPFRRLPCGRVEPGFPIELDVADEDDELVFGEWPDGHKASIDMTYGCLRKREVLRKRTQTVLAEMSHSLSSHKLSVVQKVDRKLLVVINEQSRQILQVNANTFGAVPDEGQRLPDDAPTLKLAAHFMISLMEHYAAGNCQRSDLQAERDRCCC